MSAITSLAVLGLVCAAFVAHRSRVAVAEESKAKLVGRWKVIEGRAEGTLVEFTSGGRLIYSEASGDQKVIKTGSFRCIDPSVIELSDEDGKDDTKLSVEFVSPDTFICANETPYGTFNRVSGKLVRVQKPELLTQAGH